MVEDKIGLHLHDRSTLGEALTAQEQALLNAWYTEKDADEAAILERRVVTVPNLQMLQMQVEVALAQLASTIAQLQQINAENERLKQEIAVLKQQLVIPKLA